MSVQSAEDNSSLGSDILLSSSWHYFVKIIPDKCTLASHRNRTRISS